MTDIHEMGRQTALAYGKPDEEIGWFGDEGTCPVCHQDLLTVNKTTTVECPICGIEGTLAVDGESLKVTFSKEQQERARGTFAGLREHTVEIQGFGAICGPKLAGGKEKLTAGMEKFKSLENILKNDISEIRYWHLVQSNRIYCGRV